MQGEISAGEVYPQHKQAQGCPTLLPRTRLSFQSTLGHLQLLFLISLSRTVHLRSLLGSEQGGQDKPLH